MPDPTIKIDGVTVDAMPGTLSLTYSLGNRAALSVVVKSDTGSYRPVVGKDIALFEGASKIWAGSVDDVEEYSISEADPDGAFYSILGVSWEQYLDKRPCYDISAGTHVRISRNYEFTADASTDTLTTAVAHGRSNGDKVRVRAHANGALCDGLSALIEYYVISATTYTLKLSLTAGGSAVDIIDAGTLEQILITKRAGEAVADLLIVATSEPIGTANIDLGAVVDTLIYTPATSVSEAIAGLAEASGYVWWIDEERDLFFKPRTFVAAPFSISNTSGNYRNLRVRTTREDKCNAAFIAVDIDRIGWIEEMFTGDGSTVQWDLAEPVGQIVRIQVNDEDKEFAEWLTDSDRAYYFETGTATIRQDGDETILTASDTLRVLYRKFGAEIIYEEDSADIASTATAEGASGIYGQLFERPGIGQVQASVEAQALVASRKLNVVEVEYQTDQVVESTCYQLRPGQLQTIANSYRGVSSGSFLIREVSIRDVMGQWLQFAVKAINTNRLGGAVEFWKSMGGGSAGGGSAAFVASGSSGSIPTSTSVEYTLAANTTIVSPYMPTNGDLLSVYVTQGSGPYTISFDSDFATGFNTNLPAAAGLTSVFSFRGRSDNKWWPMAAPWISE